MESSTVFMNRKTQYCYDVSPSQTDLYVHWNSNKNFNRCVCACTWQRSCVCVSCIQLDKVFLKFIWMSKSLRLVNIPEEESGREAHLIRWQKTNSAQSPETDACKHGTVIIGRWYCVLVWGRVELLSNSTWKTG